MEISIKQNQNYKLTKLNKTKTRKWQNPQPIQINSKQQSNQIKTQEQTKYTIKVTTSKQSINNTQKERKSKTKQKQKPQ